MLRRHGSTVDPSSSTNLYHNGFDKTYNAESDQHFVKMASQQEYQDLYIVTTTITTYGEYTYVAVFSFRYTSIDGHIHTRRGVIIIDTVLTGTWLGQLVFQNVHQQVIYPEQDFTPEPASSTTPRPPPFLHLGPGELVLVARGEQSANLIPESPVLTRQSSLAALVRNNIASTRDRETAPRHIPYTLGQTRQPTPAERFVERFIASARADLARHQSPNRSMDNDTNPRHRTPLHRPQLLADVPEVLQRSDVSYTYIRQGNIIRRISNNRIQDLDRANNDTPNPRHRRQSIQVNRNDTATTPPTLADYSRRRTRALLRRRLGSVGFGVSSLLDGGIATVEGHVVLRLSLAFASSGSLVGSESAEQDGT